MFIGASSCCTAELQVLALREMTRDVCRGASLDWDISLETTSLFPLPHNLHNLLVTPSFEVNTGLCHLCSLLEYFRSCQHRDRNRLEHVPNGQRRTTNKVGCLEGSLLIAVLLYAGGYVSSDMYLCYSPIV